MKGRKQKSRNVYPKSSTVRTEKIGQKQMFLLLFSLCFGLILAEFILKKFSPQKTFSNAFKSGYRCFEKSSQTVFTLKPNCVFTFEDYDTKEKFPVKINSQGIRGESVQIPNTSGKRRILMEGDSFVLGFGVKDTDVISSRLQQKLPNWQVINAGYAGGFGPDGYFLHLKNQGMKMQPDIVIFSVFVYNDLSDIDNDEWIGAGKWGEPFRVVSNTVSVDNGYLIPKKLPRIYNIPLLRESHLAIFSSGKISLVLQKLHSLTDRIRFRLSPPQFPDADAKDSNLPGIYAGKCMFGDICHRKSLHLYDDLLSVIQASREIVEGKYSDGRFHFVVLLIPADFQIIQEKRNNYQDDGIPVDSATIANPNPQRRIKDLFDKNAISYIDLLPSFRKDSENLYFDTDGHWNAKGHEKASEIVYQWITHHGW